MEVSANCAEFDFLLSHFQSRYGIYQFVEKADSIDSLIKSLWIRSNEKKMIEFANSFSLSPNQGKLLIEFFSRIQRIKPTNQRERETLTKLRDKTFAFLNQSIFGNFLDAIQDYKETSVEKRKPFGLVEFLQKNSIKQGSCLPQFSYRNGEKSQWTDSTQCQVNGKVVPLSRILPIPDISSSLEKDGLSLKEFSDLVLQCRGVEMRPPNSHDSNLEKYLLDDLLGGLAFDTQQIQPDFIDKLLKNKGVISIQGEETRLILLRHISQQDQKPCGAMILQFGQFYDTKKPCIVIKSLAVSKDFQRKNFSTLLLSYAVKIAQEADIDFIQLLSTQQGFIPYIRFGFAPAIIDIEEWKKISKEVKSGEKEIDDWKRGTGLILRLNESEVHATMQEQLHRALIDNSNPFYKEHNVPDIPIGLIVCHLQQKHVHE